MRILVCVKQVYDPKTVKISRSREELDLREAVKIINPADKYALEAALRLREAAGGEVIALTVGDAGAEDATRAAVAMGADRGILVLAGNAASGKAVTALIAAAIRRLGDIDLVLTGQAGAVDGAGTLAPRLGAALGWPVILDAIRFAADSGQLTAVAADGDGALLVSVGTPGIAAVMPGPERPRYPHPARIANAWNPDLIESWTADELGVSAEELLPDVESAGLILGPERTRGQVIGGTAAVAASELAAILRARRLV